MALSPLETALAHAAERHGVHRTLLIAPFRAHPGGLDGPAVPVRLKERADSRALFPSADALAAELAQCVRLATLREGGESAVIEAYALYSIGKPWAQDSRLRQSLGGDQAEWLLLTMHSLRQMDDNFVKLLEPAVPQIDPSVSHEPMLSPAWAAAGAIRRLGSPYHPGLSEQTLAADIARWMLDRNQIGDGVFASNAHTAGVIGDAVLRHAGPVQVSEHLLPAGGDGFDEAIRLAEQHGAVVLGFSRWWDSGYHWVSLLTYDGSTDTLMVDPHGQGHFRAPEGRLSRSAFDELGAEIALLFIPVAPPSATELPSFDLAASEPDPIEEEGPAEEIPPGPKPRRRRAAKK